MAPRNKSLKLLTIVGLPFALFLGWHLLGYPYSLDEARFLHKASGQISSGAKELDLAKLMPGDWELVCDSHAYDGPLHLKRYNKTFEPASRAQDDAWGLIFISPDGSYQSASGSCRVLDAELSTDGCIERAKAKFVRGLGSRCQKVSGQVHGGAV
jgi:hypothetical protein